MIEIIPLYIGQRVAHANGKGTVTGVNKDLSYTVVLDDGDILKEQARESFTPGESNLHSELKETMLLLAQMRGALADANRQYDEEYQLWLEQNVDIVRARSEAKELAEAVDLAARALVSRIYAEQADKTPHPSANVTLRPTPKLTVEESVAVQWAITSNRPDALKLNTSQMNTLIKAGVAPQDIGTVVDIPVVNIDHDLSALLPLVSAKPAQEQDVRG